MTGYARFRRWLLGEPPQRFTITSIDSPTSLTVASLGNQPAGIEVSSHADCYEPGMVLCVGGHPNLYRRLRSRWRTWRVVRRWKRRERRARLKRRLGRLVCWLRGHRWTDAVGDFADALAGFLGNRDTPPTQRTCGYLCTRCGKSLPPGVKPGEPSE